MGDGIVEAISTDGAPAAVGPYSQAVRAGGLLFVVFFVGTGFAAAINAILGTKWGHLINLSHLIGTVWVWLFEEPMKRGAGAVFFRVQSGEEIPIWTAWAALIGLCLFCLYLLSKKIRGIEVIR